MSSFTPQILATLGMGLVAACVHQRQRELATTNTQTNASQTLSKKSESTTEKKEEWQRLPTNVRPTHYDLTLKPDMRHATEGGSYTFEGAVTISLKVDTQQNNQQPIRQLTFHAVDMKIHQAIISQDGHEQVCQIHQKDTSQKAMVTFAKGLQSGDATLTLVYVGNLNDRMKGFYRSNYTGADGKPKIIATTQFEPTEARRALPCWDEPSFKATFSVTIVAPRGLTASSNMPIIAQKEKDGLIEHKFDVSPIMSTYLLAFIIGEFDVIEGVDSNGKIIRVYTPVGKAEQGRFSLDVALKVLPFYTKYFEIAYPLPKLDMFSIPDFSSGAMENWGIVTYRESCLLVDPAHTSQHSKQYVALVVAHELAHQWFGNLVTMEWWTHLWLNEGFATWIEYLAVDEYFSDWRIWTQFVSMDFFRSLGLDGLANSHAVEVEVRHEDEIDEIFDVISYSKGSCVIRMLAAYMGLETFRKGLVRYLNKFQYRNALTEDLWDSLAEESGLPVREVMTAWTKQVGYPVLKVFNDDSKDTITLRVEQNRFLSSSPVVDDPSLWPIPLTVQIAPIDEKESSPADSIRLIRQRSEYVSIPKPKSGAKWIKVNHLQTGHFRVQYSPNMLSNLIDAIESKDSRLDAIDRMGIQNDAFALNGANLLPVGQLFRMIRAFRNEIDYTVWSDFATNLGNFATLLKHTDLNESFCRFASTVFSNVYQQVGWDKQANESPLTSMLRTSVIANMIRYNYAPALTEALHRFDAYTQALDDEKSSKSAAGSAINLLSPDLRASVFTAAIKQRGLQAFDRVLRVYEETSMQEERLQALRALSAAADASLLRRAWDFALSDKVRGQDVFIGITNLIDNRHGANMAWQLIKENWDTFVRRFGSSFQLGRMIKSFTTFSSIDKANELETFFKTHPAPAAERAVQQTLETIRSQASWLQRDEAAIRSFLNTYN